MVTESIRPDRQSGNGVDAPPRPIAAKAKPGRPKGRKSGSAAGRNSGPVIRDPTTGQFRGSRAPDGEAPPLDLGAVAESDEAPRRSEASEAPPRLEATQAFAFPGGTAGLLLDTFDVVAVLLGRAPYYQLASEERALIEPAMGRILARLAPERVERLGKLADPLLLLAGFGLYARRIAATKLLEQAAASIPQPGTPENGHVPTAGPPAPPDREPGVIPDSIRSAFPEP